MTEIPPFSAPRDELPVMAEAWRGPLVESRHRGRAVVADASGRVIASWGAPEAPVFPRSAIKPIQALPLLETGAFTSFGLEPPELALACGSHCGEARQVRLIKTWMDRIGCRIADLECGPHAHFDEESAAELVRAGAAPTALHNNCSGKHLGMLTTARYLREPTKGYTHPDHPVQARIREALADLTGTEVQTTACGVDGCGAPAPALPLRGLATAMARFADPADLNEARAAAILKIRDAWARYATLIGGHTSFDTRLMQATHGLLLVKSGAEGFVCAVLPRQRWGLALKIEDGAPRAKNVALLALLRHLGVIDAARWRSLGDLSAPAITNWAGAAVGAVRPAPGWPNSDHQGE